MAETFCMRIGESERPEIEQFFIALSNFVGLLKDIDAAIAQKKTGNLLWRVTSLKKDPVPVIGVSSYLRRTGQDISSRVEREVFGNISAINENKEISRTFPDAALARVERIAKTTRKIGASAIYIDTLKEVKPSVDITHTTMDQIEVIREPKSSSWGMIYGELGSICIRNGNEYRVWDEDSGKPVVCNFKGSEEERIKSLLRKRVVVTGMIQANSQGFPISIRAAESVDPVDETDLPTIKEMIGLVPDFTGGVSLKEFLEEMDS